MSPEQHGGDGAPGTVSSRLAALSRSPWVGPALALAAAFLSLWVQDRVYPGMSWNRDEPVYLWHVEVLRAGQLATPDGGWPNLLQPWLSAAQDGEIYSQYTLGWPLALLVGRLLGDPGVSVMAGTALAVAGTWLLAHELFRDRTVASVSAALVLASPIIAVQSGVYLNYLFTLGLGLCFLATLLGGVRRASWPQLLGAGVLLGYIVLTRPFDGVVWAGIGGLYLAALHWREWRRHVVPALWVGIGAVPLVALLLVVNHRLTGSALEFPMTVADPLDRYGFGTRRLMPGFDPVHYGPRLALESSFRNAFWLPFFLVGAHLGAVLAAAGAWLHRRHPGTGMLLLLGIAFPVSYLAFFGTHISSLTARLSGPIYYIPAYVPLCILAALALVRLGRRSPRLLLAAVAVLVVVTVPITLDRLGVNRELSRANLPWRDSLAAAERPALVVVSPSPYVLFLNPFGHNGADPLDAPILFASDVGPDILELVASMPDRTAYLQRATLTTEELLPREDPRTPEVELAPLALLDGPAVRLEGRLTDLAEGLQPVAGVTVGGRLIPIEATSRDDGTTAVAARLVPASPAGADEAALDAQDRAAVVRLDEGLHTVHLIVRWQGVDDGDPPAERRTFYVRVADERVEVLTPGTAWASRPQDVGGPRWEALARTPLLSVQVSAASSG